jgi:hypothetical protein
MTDIRSSLAAEIRNRAQKTRDSAAYYEKKAVEENDLAGVLDSVAVKLERGEADDKFSELLSVARPPPLNLFNPLLRFGEKEESEIERLRRVFGLDGAPLATAIGKML